MVSAILKFCNKIKNFPYFFVTPLPYAIGNASEQILLAANKAKVHKKKIIIIYTNFLSGFLKYKIANKILFEGLIFNKEKYLTNDILKNLIRFLLEIEFFVIRLIVVLNDITVKIKIPEDKRFLSIGIQEIYENDRKKIKKIKEIKFSSIPKFNINYNLTDIKTKINIECQNKLKRFDLDNKRKFVCLHVRDDKYRNDKGRKDYRNSNINNYIESIIYLIKKNYLVIRIGDKPINKIKFKNKNFLDYPNSKIKSSQMDLYLIKNCSFYIGTQSGPMDTAYLFNKPVLMTNMCEIFASLPRKKEDRGIFKKVLTKKNKLLSIREFTNLPYKYHNPEIEIKNLKFVENTPEELLMSVKEFSENLYKNKKVSRMQINFNKFLIKRFEELFYENKHKVSLVNHTDAIKMIRMFKTAEGFFLNHYLKKNFF